MPILIMLLMVVVCGGEAAAWLLGVLWILAIVVATGMRVYLAITGHLPWQ